jgi:hypothetical protein
VADMRGVVPEAYELVERGQLDAAQFQAFACDNAIRLHGGMNAAFFDGTPLADYARRTLAEEPGNGHRVGDSSPTA